MAADLAAVELRALESPGDVARAADAMLAVFGPPATSPIDLRASILAGGHCLAAERAGEIVGVCWGLAAFDDAGPYVHSHVTSVADGWRGRGVGERLKREQARWCKGRGIDRIAWTFDPLQAANARFNLNRLGAVADGWIRDCYGPLFGPLDPATRFGEPAPSDRLHVTWRLGASPSIVEGEEQRVPLPPAPPVGRALEVLRASCEPLFAEGWIAVALERREDGGAAYRFGRRARPGAAS